MSNKLCAVEKRRCQSKQPFLVGKTQFKNFIIINPLQQTGCFCGMLLRKYSREGLVWIDLFLLNNFWKFVLWSLFWKIINWKIIHPKKFKFSKTRNFDMSYHNNTPRNNPQSLYLIHFMFMHYHSEIRVLAFHLHSNWDH